MFNIDILIAICGGAILGYLLRHGLARTFIKETFFKGITQGIKVGYEIREEEHKLEAEAAEEAKSVDPDSDSIK